MGGDSWRAVMDGNLGSTEQFLWPISVFSGIVMCKIISIGYFLADLGMILWCFPSLGGIEYVLHHGLSLYALALSLISGKAQFYILKVLFSEIMNPFVNLSWYLHVYGQKNSTLFICNGVALFLGWLAVRIILFVVLFIHMYLHFDQVRTLFPLAFYSIISVLPLITVMNAYWFWKISKAMMTTLSRKRHEQ